MLTETQIQENWDRFQAIVADKALDNDRWAILQQFYTKYEQRFAFMPASGKTSFHSAFPGGHVSHTLNVVDNALKLSKLWKSSGGGLNYTDEELVFVALNHDIGKFGTDEAETFIDQDSNWHRERGEVYKHNPNLPFMKDYDRSLFLLQSLGVSISENEYLAIKLQSGLYEESNKSYFIAYSEEYKLRSDLPYIIHQADAMAARIESTMYSKPASPVKSSFKPGYKKAPKPSPMGSKLKKFLND